MKAGRTGAPSIRARINYGVDVLIAVAFVLAGVIGIAMMAGVLGHLVLHARWIGCMTRNLLRRGAQRPRAVESCPTEVGGGIT